MAHTKTKGDISEAMIAARLLQSGKAVSKPMGDNQRYDLIVDDGIKLLKVQCKTGRLKAGAVLFATCSSTNKDMYVGQVDLFGVYCPELDSVYIIPMADCLDVTREKSLRVVPTKSGQVAGTTLASKYKI